MRLRPTCSAQTRLTLLGLCALTLSFGCAVEGGDGAGRSFAFADHFEPDEAIVEERANETMLRLDRVEFDFDTANLTAGSRAILDKFAAVFEALPGARYSIEAHTDSRGNSAANLALTEDRAEAVRDYLVDVVGGPAVAFTTVGWGETRPIADDATAQGRALNRRIEVIVSDDAGDPVFRVMLAADRIDVVLDCDDFTSSPSAAAGDFYIQTTLYSDDDRGRVLMTRTPNTLAQLDAGESSDLTIVADERFIAGDDAVLTGIVGWYENDSGGVRQFDFSEAIRLYYDRDDRCWVDLDAGNACISSAQGEIEAGVLSVNQPPTIAVDGCIATLEWSLMVERVR